MLSPKRPLHHAASRRGPPSLKGEDLKIAESRYGRIDTRQPTETRQSDG